MPLFVKPYHDPFELLVPGIKVIFGEAGCEYEYKRYQKSYASFGDLWISVNTQKIKEMARFGKWEAIKAYLADLIAELKEPKDGGSRI